ncbi:MAG: C69 family dipeptidase [Bacteroidales bacterium]|nr:C69 family dipeptidase [Bacteroidales bacterium]
MKRCMITVLLSSSLLMFSPSGQSCTTMIVTKGASADGSMMVAHSDDDELGDQRMIFVPSRLQTGTRSLYQESYRYPRINTTERGPGYSTPGYPMTPALFQLPYEDIWSLLGHKNEYSYAYFDANYGIMNEYNLMFGECTNGANFEPEATVVKAPGKPMRLFYSQELSRIALENCKTAREAIVLMGKLIERYGYYSTGETLLVADENEAWVFEMCALPDDVYHSAWVAQRVPDGEFFVAANEFRIRFLVKNDPDNFLFSEYLIPGLKKLGWWNEEKDGPVDWLKAVSPGEYNHPYYSLRRVWRVLDRVNPDLGLSPWVENGYTFDYPFSVKPKDKLTTSDVFSLYRDHYEGTQFDMTKGVASGPYGDPNRFVGLYDGNQNDVSSGKKMIGAWERAISVFYQGYTYVCQLRPGKQEPTKGLVWFGPDVSYTTVFMPFYSKAFGLPEALQAGGPQKFYGRCAWWPFNFVNNWSRLNFHQITRSDIIPMQSRMEQQEMQFIAMTDKAVEGLTPGEASTVLTERCQANADSVIIGWWHLAATIVAKYSDGYINLPNGDYSTPPCDLTRVIGYPAVWLNETDYSDGPTTYEMK